MTEWTASFIEVQLVIGLDVTQASRLVLGALGHAPWPPVSEWRSLAGTDAPMRHDSLSEFLAGATVHDLEWKHESLIRGLAMVDGDGARIDLHITDTAVERCWRWLVASEELIHRLLTGDVRLTAARVMRNGVGAKCLPALRAIGGATHMIAADDDWLGEGFEDVAAAIAAGKWDARRLGELHVLARAMHAETNVELMGAIWEGQWAMARLARPGTCTYDLDEEPEPEELPIFRRGERRLLAVGYDEAARASIYSCVLEAGQHVQPWEIWTLGQALRRKVMPSGEQIDAIRVIFADQASAMRERRPLLDVGVTVQHQGSDGKMVTLPRDA